MNRLFFALCLVFGLSACVTPMGGGDKMAAFWRPMSEPNILLPPQRAQRKLDFDLSQCKCGMYPTNIAQTDLIDFQPDKQRYIETSVTRTGKRGGDCMQQPNLVVGECMRMRGWERTNCSGRMGLASGGSLCAGAMIEEE